MLINNPPKLLDEKDPRSQAINELINEIDTLMVFMLPPIITVNEARTEIRIKQDYLEYADNDESWHWDDYEYAPEFEENRSILKEAWGLYKDALKALKKNNFTILQGTPPSVDTPHWTIRVDAKKDQQTLNFLKDLEENQKKQTAITSVNVVAPTPEPVSTPELNSAPTKQTEPPIDMKTEQRIRGIITKLHFSSPQFTAGRITKPNGETLSFSGKIAVNLNDRVILVGFYVVDPKYGLQIKAHNVELDLALDKYGLENFLKNNKEIRNIGEKKARMIVDRYGDSFETYLQNNPEDIAKYARIPLVDVLELQKIWERDKELNAIMIWLSSFGLTHHQVTVITDIFGNNAKAIFESNPYQMIGLIDNFGFKRCDEIARKIGVTKDDPNRIKAGILYSLSEELDQGHCWTEYFTLIDLANTLLIMDCLDSKERITQKIRELISEGLVQYELFNGVYCLGLPSILKTERYLYQSFLAGREPNPHFDTKDINSYEKRLSQTTLNEQQQAAVLNFLKNQKSLISGGAGTGKTYTLTTILNLCNELNLEVALAAPTGKAAKRMEQVTGHLASTVHRLLGFQAFNRAAEGIQNEKASGQSFFHNEDNPLDYDVIIVDEFSMMDIFLTQSLLRAITKDTAVVFVGDHNQLPPVGAGNVLRDLILYQVIPTVILSQVVRQSGALKENSYAILSGKVAPSIPQQINEPSPWLLENFKKDDHVEMISQRIGHLFNFELEQLGFDILRDVQLLTPTHKGELGTRNLNACLQVLIQHKIYNNPIEKTPDGKKVFYVGDKVIQTKNDYDIQIMNGAIGFITGFGEEEIKEVDSQTKELRGTGKFKSVIYVDFNEPGEDNPQNRVFVSKSENHLQLAYALTIHKSQGSEFPCVILIIHKSHWFQHHRGLLYTGVTRARKSVRILGDRWSLNHCAETVKADIRRTYLSIQICKSQAEKDQINMIKAENNSVNTGNSNSGIKAA